MLRPHRCRNCKSHFSFRRPLQDYARQRRCPHCGSTNIRYDEYEWNRRLKRRQHVCRCYGVPFPHRKGSIVWCVYHPTGPLEEDYANARFCA